MAPLPRELANSRRHFWSATLGGGGWALEGRGRRRRWIGVGMSCHRELSNFQFSMWRFFPISESTILKSLKLLVSSYKKQDTFPRRWWTKWVVWWMGKNWKKHSEEDKRRHSPSSPLSLWNSYVLLLQFAKSTGSLWHGRTCCVTTHYHSPLHRSYQGVE